MTPPNEPCEPMRADESHPDLRGLLDRCHHCGDYLDCEECLEVVVRLSNWLERSSPALRDRVRRHLNAGG